MAKRSRSERRAAERAVVKTAAAAERLFTLEAGGSPERALEVSSPSVVEMHAESLPCPRCGGRHEVREHRAVTSGRRRLREARLTCRQCGSTRSAWFRLIPAALPN